MPCKCAFVICVLTMKKKKKKKKRNTSLCAASGVLSDVVIFSDCPSGSITDEVLVKGQ